MLFYLSYIILYVSLFIGDIYNVGGLDIFAKYLRLCSYALISFSCINMKLGEKEFVRIVIIFIITLVYSIQTGDLYWSILILLICNSKRVNIESIFKISFQIMMIGIIGVLIFCLIGFLPDILTSRNTVEQINYNRHSFGFYHSNVLPLLIFYLEVYYICIVKDKIKDGVIVLFMVAAGVASIFCHARNALIVSMALSIFIILIKRKENRKEEDKLLYKITILSIPCMSIFSFAMMFLLLKGGVWNTIDTFFSGRFRLAIFKMRRVGLHLINIMNNETFANDNIAYVNGENLNTVILDNGYLYIMLRYGILILLIYFLVAYFLAKKNRESVCILGTLIAVFIANFVDNDLVDYSFLPFVLWAFNDWQSNNLVKNAKEKVNGIYTGKWMKT